MRGIQLKVEVFTAEMALKKYIIHCQIKNLSEQTIKLYLYESGKFVKWFGVSEAIGKVNIDVFEEFILSCKQEGHEGAYLSTRVRQIRSFLYWCMEREYVQKFKINIPKADETVKEPYTAAEITKLIRKPTGTTYVEWRTWAMINFFVGTGCRLSTVLNLKVSDIDFSQKLITLRKLKNRKVQILPLSTGLSKALKLYLSFVDFSDDDYLFPNFENKLLCVRSAQCSIVRYNKSRGVSKTSIHLFRHTFAKMYILAGGGALQLQKILGHSTLDMTNHYVALYATDLAIGFDALSPLDNLKRL